MTVVPLRQQALLSLYRRSVDRVCEGVTATVRTSISVVETVHAVLKEALHGSSAGVVTGDVPAPVAFWKRTYGSVYPIARP